MIHKKVNSKLFTSSLAQHNTKFLTMTSRLKRFLMCRFLKAANACRYWPNGRGIYHNKDKTFLVWVNEEDHLRLISMQQGGNVGQVLDRLIRVSASAMKPVTHRQPRGQAAGG